MPGATDADRRKYYYSALMGTSPLESPFSLLRGDLFSIE
jgi:hypothetical protein